MGIFGNFLEKTSLFYWIFSIISGFESPAAQDKIGTSSEVLFFAQGAVEAL